MLNKRGYSFGAQYKYHYEQRANGWAVFNAKSDRDLKTGLTDWDAFQLAWTKNGSPEPVLQDIDETP